MKVLHVIPSLSLHCGGPSVALPLMARGLAAMGIHVDVATTDDDGPGRRMNVRLDERVEHEGYGVYYFRKQTDFYKISLPLARWVKERVADYDVVHIHALFSFSSVASARHARRRGVPYILRPLGVLNDWGRRHRRPFLKALSLRWIEGPLLRHAAAMHYTSRQEQIEARAAGAPGRPMILPLEIDVRSYEQSPGPQMFLEQFPQAKGRALVLFLSRLDAKKGLDLLLPAFAKARQRHPQAMLVMAGGGSADYVAGLHVQARQLGLENDVIWTGFISGQLKLSAMNAARLFVLPSYSENFGIVLVEAMACGLPSITTEGVAAAEFVAQAEAGIVVQAEQSALAVALERLLNDAELCARFGDNARRFARERFSPGAMAAALESLYREVISAAN